MTVKDLIQELEIFNPKMEVVFRAGRLNEDAIWCPTDAVAENESGYNHKRIVINAE